MGQFNTAQSAELMLKSRPIPVYWFGWQSDTFVLQKEGWQFAVHSDPSMWNFHFVMKHPDMYLVALFDEYHYPREMMDPHYHGNIPPLTVNRVRPNIEVCKIQTSIDYQFKQTDMEQSFMLKEEVKTLDDLLPFNMMRHPVETTKEVIIETQADMDVVDHLQAILDQQEEKQAELRRQRLDPNRIQEDVKVKQVKFQVVA